MRQRDKSAGKRQHPKTLRRRNAPKTARHRNSVAAKETNVARLSRELSEAFEQQAATADILNIISNSPTDTQPVFDAIVQSGLKLFPDALISLALRYGNTINAAAIAEPDPEGAEAWRRSISRTPLSREYMHGTAMLDRKIVDIPDVRNAPAELATGARNFLTSGYRAITITPMMRRNEAIGLLSVVRRTPGPLSDKQLSLLRTFAAQAVIAIENARLMNELRQRTDDLSESLEQQTATSEVLKVISSSASDLQPVFDTMAENVVRLCDAERAYIFRFDGELLRAVATYNVGPENREFVNHNPIAPGRHSVSARAALERRSVQVPDVQADPEFAYAIRDVDPIRTVLAVPMLKSDDLVGTITIYRLEVKPFTEKQVTLVETFAAQAVIAIENTRLLSELRESLEQQTATSEVLKVISSSSGELEPIFKAMLENAVRICGAQFANLALYDGSKMRMAALHNAPRAFEELRRSDPVIPLDRSVLGIIVQTKKVAQISDMTAEEPYASWALVKLAGARAVLAVPMLREGELVGAIVIYRTEPTAFNEKQIELLTNFASQAVIAIENARLLNELRESLQQQTATADVLKVISRSTFALQTVLDTLTESAARLCEADIANIWLPGDPGFRLAASYQTVESNQAEYLSKISLGPSRGSCVGRTLLEGRTVHIHDIRDDPEYELETSKLEGYRTMLGVPLLREGTPVGVIALVRSVRRPFTPQQIELVNTFADQAVIAIENTRLLNELRESLQQQTATADVLKVISRSTFDLRVVVRTLVESAAQLCEAQQAIVTQRGDDGLYRLTASFGFPDEFDEYMRQNPLAPGRATTTGRVALEGKMVHIPDVLADPEYAFPKGQQLGGYRSNLGVPLLRDGVPIGAFVLMRPVVKPFSDKQIELVETFADQAVIAIENVRLLSELRESLQQQTATADVLKVISRSTFDLQAVLDTLTESACRLCDADASILWRPKDDVYMVASNFGQSASHQQAMLQLSIRPGRETCVGRVLVEQRTVHIPDCEADPEYKVPDVLRVAGNRAILGVPLVREGLPIGVLAVTRSTARPFTEKQIELVKTFADQAVIAIENVRLFDEVQTRTRDLAKSLEELRTTQDRLVQTQKLALLGQLTAGIAHEIKNPLNFVNNFSGISSELIGELQDTLKGMPLDDKARTEINELTDTLKGNFDKVVHHGRRADAIVKNMLQHSREGSGEHRVIDINGLVEESLNLAWHGARAETQGFEVKLEQSFDPSAGGADVFPQDIRRALLNLIANGFYAATRRRAETNGGDYEPTLTTSTKNLGDRVEVRIRDNGTGMTPDVKEKMFNPFFTTKPTGEGTGLGLSISHDIIVKQHAGSIEVDTQLGEFTEIRVILPRSAVFV